MRKLIKISIWILISVSILFLGYRTYGNALSKYLYCNDVFIPVDESFINSKYFDKNYKFYKWESERLDCQHGMGFEYRTIEFISDSSALICTKSNWGNSIEFSFPFKYFFGIYEFQTKEYDLYKIKEDTLYKNVTSKDFQRYGYILQNDSITRFDTTSVLFEPYTDYATFQIVNDRLILSEVNRKKYN